MPTQLTISRNQLSSQYAIYNWTCCGVSQNVVTGTANSLEACLIAATALLAEHDDMPEKMDLVYRKVALGSFPLAELESFPAQMAERIVESYDQQRLLS